MFDAPEFIDRDPEFSLRDAINIAINIAIKEANNA